MTTSKLTYLILISLLTLKRQLEFSFQYVTCFPAKEAKYIMSMMLSIIIGLTFSCSSQKQIQNNIIANPAKQPVIKNEYKIQQGDEISIKFPYHQELNTTLMIPPDGFAQLLLVGKTHIANKTVELLTTLLNEKYSIELINPEIVINIISMSNQNIFIGGQVKSPGIIPLKGDLSIMGAIFQAGWVTQGAKLENVILFRKDPSQNIKMIKIDVKQMLTGKNSLNNINLEPFDILYVPHTAISKVKEFVSLYIDGLLPLSTITGFAWSYRMIREGY